MTHDTPTSLDSANEAAEPTNADRHAREAADALRESEARQRLLVERWAQAAWEVNGEGGVVADSPSWRLYTGQTLEENGALSEAEGGGRLHVRWQVGRN